MCSREGTPRGRAASQATRWGHLGVGKEGFLGGEGSRSAKQRPRMGSDSGPQQVPTGLLAAGPAPRLQKGSCTGERGPPSGSSWQSAVGSLTCSASGSSLSCLRRGGERVSGAVFTRHPLLSTQKKRQPWCGCNRPTGVWPALYRLRASDTLGASSGKRRGPPLCSLALRSIMRKSSADSTEGAGSHPLISFRQSCCPRAPGKSPGMLRWSEESGLFSQPETGHPRTSQDLQAAWH